MRILPQRVGRGCQLRAMVHVSRGLGPTQRRLLAIISQGVDGEFAAFEISYLKSLVGGDRSNLRRAIRGLLRRKLI